MWDESDEEVIADIESPPSVRAKNNFSHEDRKLMVLIKWIAIFISRLRASFSLSDAASNFILNFSWTLWQNTVSFTC